ncbi:MAG: O-acetyl-ADP-ribose deacetylase [Candidatus Bathyarchaeota archaeon]|nr:O-acetyl-ADP-ribose deacetylase [Candidatus Bathyarchaeota archaeon]
MLDEYEAGTAKVRLIKGDIISMETDAIVNAANNTLLGGGGVDGAIHSRGGPKILEECKHLRAVQYPKGLPTGQATITGAGNLKAKYVIHTVGPVWHGGNQGEKDLLRQAYENSLCVAVVQGLRSVAFPSISTGAYGYPLDEASQVALEAVKQFLSVSTGIEEVVFVLFSDRALQAYQAAAKAVFGK